MDEGDPEQVARNAKGNARPGADARSTFVEPADGHDRDPVAAPPRQVDKLDVKDDARDSLPFEEILGGIPPESLEPALGVLHRTDHPYGGQQVEHLAQHAAISRLAG